MELRCPKCEYSRNIDGSAIAATVTLATCPRCGHRFKFREQGDAAVAAQTDATGRKHDAERWERVDLYDSIGRSPLGAGGTERRSGPEQQEEARHDHTGKNSPAGDSANGTSGGEAGHEGAQPPQQAGPELWAYMREVGIVPAFILTTRQILLRPHDFFAGMSKTVSFFVPFSYYMLASLLGIAFDTLWQIAVGNPILPEAFSMESGGLQELVIMLLYSPVVMMLYLYLLAAVLHLGLMLTGVAKPGSSPTLRVVCYSSAAELLSVIPVVGSVLGGIVRLWLLAVGLKEVYGTSMGRIVPAIGLLLLALLVVVALVMRDMGLM